MGDDMTLSREIVVLDLKDKQPSDDQQQAADSTTTTNNNNDDSSIGHKSPLRSRHLGDEQDSSSSSSSGYSNNDETGKAQLHCVTSRSLLLLICSIGSFFVLYVCLVAYFFARRDSKISVIKHQYH